MNIKHYLSAFAALAMLAACSDYDPGMSDQAMDLTDAEIQTIEEYTANFVERYGEMDPNHTWGFGYLAGTEEMGTRASEPNSNQWVKVIKGKIQAKDANNNLLWKDEEGNPSTTATRPDGGERQPYYLYGGADVPIHLQPIVDGVVIPGFPVQNYYLSANYNKEDSTDPTKPKRDNDVREGTTTQTPPNYQDKYHCKFPGETTADGNPIEHWFSSEEEVLQYMRGEHPDNTSGKMYDELIPLGDVKEFNDITDAEVADVYAEFSKRVEPVTNPDIDLKSYFVQQVWCGDASYTATHQDGHTSEVIGGEHMDYLAAKGDGYIASDREHFYNFNLANSSHGQKGMMLIYDSSTQNFAYYNSYQADGDCTIWDHYRLVNLHGNWYVGFDFESVGAGDKNIPRDHRYNDWIVKIIPGKGTIGDEETIIETDEETEEQLRTISRRVLCEDLGNTYDFDFNDLVFDVTYEGKETRTKTTTTITKKKKSDGSIIEGPTTTISYSDWAVDGDGWTGTITLQASGGTLPISIENFDNTRYECHEWMAGADHPQLKVGSLYNPINVGVNLDGIPAKALPTISHLSSANPDDINIWVNGTDRAVTTTALLLPPSRGDQYDGTQKAPQKICVPLKDGVVTKWPKEHIQIESVYTYFRNWVNEENSDYNFGKNKDWRNHGLENQGSLY